MRKVTHLANAPPDAFIFLPKGVYGMCKFEEGKTYQTRSIGDNNCIFEITVIKRTAKTVTYKQWDGREVWAGKCDPA